MEKIAVLIPCFNEGKTIGKVVHDFQLVLPEATIYVYDNNSTDNTVFEAEHAGAVVGSEQRQGKGNVDDTYPAENAAEMCSYIIDKGYDMVIGDRLSSTYSQENKRPFHDFGNRMVRYIINTIFNSDIKDIMTGYRALSRQMVLTTPLLSEGFEIETEMTINSLDNQMKIHQIAVDYKDRPMGSISKLHTFSDGFKIVKTIFRLFRDYKPLVFFSYVSLFLILLSFCFLFPVLFEYFQTGLVPRFPTLIVCGFMILFALMLIICGIILQVQLNHHRQLRQLINHIQSK